MLDGGIWRIPLPMPFGPPYVNVYLLPCPGGWMLVDAGMPTRDSWDALAGTMADLGISPSQLCHIVVTHLHPDHSGLAAELRQASGATVWMHADDVRLLDVIKNSRHSHDELESAMREAGTAEPMRQAVLSSYDRLLRSFPLLTPDALLQDGQTLESWVGPLEVVWTPGHAPGHCCLFAREQGLLFSGDHVIEEITPHVGWLPGEDTLGQFLASLDRLAQLGASKVLPGHGTPFDDLAGWIARTREHHTGRLSEIESHYSNGVTLADDLVRRLWPRELRPLDYQLAITEVLAHLEHLRRKARILG